MKLAIFAGDFPYPARMGGTVDVWNRITSFAEAGCEILLVCWQAAEPSARPSPEALAHVRSRVSELHLLTYRSGAASVLSRLMALPVMPFGCSARLQPVEHLTGVRAATVRFDPDAIWLDNVMVSPLVHDLARRSGRPYFIRSHNREHLYQAALARTSRGSKALKHWLNTLGLKRFEERALRQASRFYDISQDDLRHWQTRGLDNGRWLPTLMLRPQSAGAPRYDVAYLGSLATPTNTEGIVWFVENVLPAILERRPEFTCLIAGSEPPASLAGYLRNIPGVTLKTDVPDSAAAWSAGRVLINPVLSGSGVAVKSIEMLFYDRPLVTTACGVRGLPAAVAEEFAVEGSASAFAAAVLSGLRSPAAATPGRERVRALFGREQMASVLADIRATAARELAEEV